MRLRRMELIFVGLTLAFVFFMGGFFAGRSYDSVAIEDVGSLRVETSVGQTAQETEPKLTEHNNHGNSSNQSVIGSPANDMTVNANNDSPQMQIPDVVPAPGEPIGGDGRININTASKNELMDLPGIGPSLAENIIEYRNNNGVFRSIEDIMNVSGIATGRFEKIKDKITI